MKLGVMQGRLTEPINNCIQEFPSKWMLEFQHLRELKLNHIEWLVTKNSFHTNPLLSKDYLLYSLPISSICADNLVDHRISDENFLKNNLIPICEAALKNMINNITIPLLEESVLEDDIKHRAFSKAMVKIGRNFPTINFTFESEMKPDRLLEIVDLADNFYVTYDTGNITSCGFSHVDYINFFKNKINNVHLKDRTRGGETVIPTLGDTDFKTIFQTLKEIGYNRFYTMQTARGHTGCEFETIREHKSIFEKIYE